MLTVWPWSGSSEAASSKYSFSATLFPFSRDLDGYARCPVPKLLGGGRSPDGGRLEIDVNGVGRDHDGVLALRVGHAQIPLAEILLDPLEPPLERRPVAPAAGDRLADDVAALEHNSRELRVAGDSEGLAEGSEGAAAVLRDENRRGGAVLPAEEPERRDALPLHEHRDGELVAVDAELPDVTPAAAVLAGSGGALPDPERPVRDRVAGLENLHSLQGAVAVRDAETGVSVLRRPAAPPAAVVQEIHEHLPRHRVDAAEGENRRRPAVVGRDSIGDRLGERSIDGHHDVRMHFGVPADERSRILDVHDRSRRGDDSHWAVRALVRGNRLVGEVKEGVVGCTGGDAVRAVDRPAALTVGAAVVDGHVVAVDGDLEPELRRLGRQAVVVADELLELVDAVGHVRDLRPHAPLRVVLDRLRDLEVLVDAVLLHELEHPPLG